MGRAKQHKLSGLKWELDKPTCPWESQLSEFVFPFCIWKGRECPWGTHSNTRTTIDLYNIIAINWTLWHGDHPHPLAFKPLWPLLFWLRPMRKSLWDSPLTIFVPHAVETLLNSHHSMFLSQLPNLLLTVPHITLYFVIILTRLLCFPLSPHNCLTVMDHLLMPCDGPLLNCIG